MARSSLFDDSMRNTPSRRSAATIHLATAIAIAVAATSAACMTAPKGMTGSMGDDGTGMPPGAGADSGSVADAGSASAASADAGSDGAGAGVAAGGDAGAPTASPGAVDAFKTSFYAFAVANCVTCHGLDVSPAFAVPDVPTAYANAKPFASFASPASSLLVVYAGNGHCGLSYCADNSSAALAALQTWAKAEATAAPAPPARPPVSDLATLELVQADLAAQPSTKQPYLRYFTLESYGNTAGQPTLVPTDVARAALIKMVNFLSTARAIVRPDAIDAPTNLVYRVDMRALNWTAAAWTNVKKTDPYFVPANFPASLASSAAKTMRADWFVANIPNSAVNAYFTFLGIDSDDPTIDAKNNVNRFADMAVGAPATVRAGLPVSNTEDHNRILSWHQTTSLGSGAIGSGYLFKSYNFDTDTGTQNIFSHPYMPTTNDPNAPGPYDFTYADSDNIFSLPNGLNGYYTVEGAAQGQVMNQANAGAPFPGPTFCFQCHDSKTNMVPMVDHMHATLSALPPGTFPPATLALLEGMYDQTAMNAKMAAAGTAFGAAFAQLDLPVTELPGIATESTNIVTSYYGVVLNVATAAAEIGVTPSQLVTSIKGSSALSLQIGSLITTDASGTPNGVVRRDLWESSYAAVRSRLFPQLPAVAPPP